MINARDARSKTNETLEFRARELAGLLKPCEEAITEACTAGIGKCVITPSWLGTPIQTVCIEELIRLGYVVVVTPCELKITW